MGLKAGIQYEIQLMKNQTSKTKDKSTPDALAKVIKDSNKVLHSLGM